MLARFPSLLLFSGLLLLASCSTPPSNSAPQPSPKESSSIDSPEAALKPEPSKTSLAGATSQTVVLMHNVILNERPGLKLRVRWLRGQMRPTRPDVVPSFDEPRSFILNVRDGVIATNLSDISGILNGGLLKNTQLSNVSLEAQGKQLKLKGTLHKGVPLPIEMISDVSSSPDGRIHLHVAKLRVLKVPVTGLLQSLHVTVGDIFTAQGATGVQVSKDDVYINAE